MRVTLLFQQLLGNFFILSFGKVPFTLHHPIYSHPFPLLILREDKVAFVWPARYDGAVRKAAYATGCFHYIFRCMHNGPECFGASVRGSWLSSTRIRLAQVRASACEIEKPPQRLVMILTFLSLGIGGEGGVAAAETYKGMGEGEVEGVLWRRRRGREVILVL